MLCEICRLSNFDTHSHQREPPNYTFAVIKRSSGGERLAFNMERAGAIVFFIFLILCARIYEVRKKNIMATRGSPFCVWPRNTLLIHRKIRDFA